VDIVNESGPAHATFGDGAGAGLTGMRKRAVALGGSLEAGPRPGGGFRVHAQLPTAMAPAELEAADMEPAGLEPADAEPGAGRS